MIGLRVTDRITGFCGVVTGEATYLTGCSRVLVEPPLAADGSMRDAQWIDAQRVVANDDRVVTLDNGSTPGAGIDPPKS